MTDPLAAQPRESGECRSRLFERAILSASGQLGYRNVTVQTIIDRTELSRSLFYRLFSDKSDCYAAAYARAITQLTEQMLAGCGRESTFPSRLRAALEVIAKFVDADPVTARALLLEVHVARGAGLDERDSMIERLAEALDNNGRALRADPTPPPLSGLFLVHTVEMAVARSLLSGESASFAESIPSIVSIATSLYRGPDASEPDAL